MGTTIRPSKRARAPHAFAGRITAAVMLAMLAGMLASCGGGGGSSTPPAFDVNALPSWPSLAAQCAAPRSGTDPISGQAYPDRKATLRDEQNWLASWTNDTYLWYGDVSYPDPAGYSTALDYFNVLKSPLKTASGRAKDQFHFTYPTSVWESLSTTGVQAGYGVTWVLVSRAPPRQAVVGYIEAGSPATQSPALLTRGAQVLMIDGVDFINAPTQADVTILNAGLYPSAAGETHTFQVLDPGAVTPRTFTVAAANVTVAPVPIAIPLPGGVPGNTVGYLLFNDHLATAESALVNAVTALKAAGTTDLVLDIRYNSGGYLDIASELAYMIAGGVPTSGKAFDRLRFNGKHPTNDPVTGATLAPTPFLANGIGFTDPALANAALPHLDLQRVFVLTGPGTCSASEAVINGLAGVGVQVIQIGSATCGKPYGFYPADNCGTTYFSIQFQGVNQAGFGNYPDGFVPVNGVTAGIDPGAVLPGCQVADDFTHALGDPAEARLSAALAYRGGGAAACPAPSALARPGVAQALRAADGAIFKSVFQSNRILRAKLPAH